MSLSDQVFETGFNMSGRHLVQASAGTGKTYSIQTLYLRLILLEGLTVQQILVVTFTKQATKELRERLQKILRETLEALKERNAEPEQRVQDMIGLTINKGITKPDAQRRLQQALLDFDLAAIYTIHGFCKRTLERFAFETGQPFDVEPLEDSKEELRQLCRDWWRQNVYPADPRLVKWIEQQSITLSDLTNVAAKVIAKPDSRLLPMGLSLEEADRSAREALEPLKSDTDLVKPVGNLTKNQEGKLEQIRAQLRYCQNLFREEKWCEAYSLLFDVAQMSYDKDKQKNYFLANFAPKWQHAFETATAAVGGLVPWAVEAIVRLYLESRGSSMSATFDDYLLNLRQALKKEEGGNGALHEALRTEFKAALIDEFQDTDPVQWGIFNDIFTETSNIPCFLVGDPKQAIYRFRNGDIETYLKATARVEKGCCHVLNKNYRAEERLIAGVNQVFMDRGFPTFKNEAIHYEKKLEAKGKKPEESLMIDGRPDEKPLKIWLIQNQSSGSIPGKESATARHAYRLTARGICEILNDDKTKIAGKRVQPGQIAVLICKHDEAAFIAKELKNLGIPCVRQGTGNVWSTDEAKHFWVILKSILNPEDVNQLRGALCAPWIGLSNDDIVRLNHEESVSFRRGGSEVPRTLADWVIFFEDLRDTWLKRGFSAMFGKLAACLNLRAAFVVQPNGIRSLTNIFHLSEQIQRAIVDGRKSPEGVLAWVQSQLDAKESEGGETNKIRMESDDNAVKIMTVFNSKGLEFPIVFAPTLFMLKPFEKRKVFEYHGQAPLSPDLPDLSENQETESGDSKVLYITQDDQGKKLEDAEIAIEHRRHIYVALTRGVHRTVVIALKPNEENKTTGVFSEVLNTTKWSASDPDAYFSPEDRGKCAVEVRDGDAVGEACKFTPETFSVADGVPPKPAIDKLHGHGSYSALAPKGHEEEAAGALQSDSKDNDGVTAAGAPEAPPDDKPEKPQGIFAFPAGAKTGTCWHEIFEDIPFDADDAAVDEIVKDKLTAYGFLKKPEHVAKRCSVTGDMVKKVLNVALPSKNKAHGEFSLKDVARCDRKTEWEFSFSAQAGKRTSALKFAISEHPQYADFMKALGEWDREIPGGYLTGFIDLLFRHDGRYYIVDWKSNRRKGKQEDFNAKGVQEEMSLHGYWLQYLVYCVAVHQYLKAALPDYGYDTHFGGVYYLFLRGINGTGDGIYSDRPPKALIEELSSLFGDFT